MFSLRPTCAANLPQIEGFLGWLPYLGPVGKQTRYRGIPGIGARRAAPVLSSRKVE